jgi:hypothetical protein
MRVLLFLLIGACASPNQPRGRDGGAVDSAGSPDVIADGDDRGEWGAPRQLVAVNTSAHERFAVLGDGGFSVLFARTEASGSLSVNRPYVAHRSALADPFNPAARAAAFGDTSIHDFELSTDGLEWLTWKGLGQLAVSRRPSTDEPWSPPAELGFDGFSPSLSADGLSLYYLGLGDAGLIVRRRASPTTPWGQPRALLVAGERTPIAIDISSDELSLLVTADTRLPGGGVFIARRSSPSDDFDAPLPIESLAGTFESARFGDGDQWITATDSRGSDRELVIVEKQ